MKKKVKWKRVGPKGEESGVKKTGCSGKKRSWIWKEERRKEEKVNLERREEERREGGFGKKSEGKNRRWIWKEK